MVTIRSLLCLPLLCAAGSLGSNTGFHCPQGDPVTADLGDGVVMRTCMWQNEAQDRIRIGPFELAKNGILIVKTQTNSEGQLHGRFTSWTDDGVIIKDGHYQDGQKHGAWIETNAEGIKQSLHYHEGEVVQP